MIGKTGADPAADARPLLATGQQLSLSTYWFSLNFLWGGLLSIVIPAQVLLYVPDERKGFYFGLSMATGAFLATIIQPIVGALSDRSAFRLGRRRPYVLLGSVLSVAALAGMAYAPVLGVFIASLFVLQLTANVSGAAYQGMIPDLVPASQRGAASGYMGLMSILGTAVASVSAGLMLDSGLRVGFYWLTVVIMVAGMIVTAAGVVETPLQERRRLSWKEFWGDFWISPKKHPDFAWLFVTRFLVMVGFYAVYLFLEYYLKDVLQMRNYATATMTVVMAVLAGSVAATFTAGWLSDRAGRKVIVFIAGLLMATTCFVLISTRSYPLVVAFGVVFGLGYGAYLSVDWALAVDVLPTATHAATDLGIWSIAVTLPQVIVTAIGGPVLDVYNKVAAGLGYTVVFASAIACLMLGSVLVWKIRGSR